MMDVELEWPDLIASLHPGSEVQPLALQPRAK